MTTRSGSSLFLIEQIIVIAVFAICAAVCVSIFAGSYIIANSGSDLNNAVLAADSGAESFKAFPDDLAQAADILDGAFENGMVSVYYDEDWKKTVPENALYILRLEPYDGTGDEEELLFCDVTVERLDTGANAGIVIEFTVASRKGR